MLGGWCLGQYLVIKTHFYSSSEQKTNQCPWTMALVWNFVWKMNEQIFAHGQLSMTYPHKRFPFDFKFITKKQVCFPYLVSVFVIAQFTSNENLLSILNTKRNIDTSWRWQNIEIVHNLKKFPITSRNQYATPIYYT